MNESHRKHRIPGYKILIIAFAANFVGTGIGFYGFSVFFNPLTEYFGHGRMGVGWGPGISLIVGALWAPRVGNAVDRWGPRPLLMGGSLAVAVALLLMSRMTAYWQFLMLFGVIFSLANLHIGDIVTGSTVAKQFPENTGRALGIATVGVSFGGVVMPPVTQYLIDLFDWRTGFVGLSLFSIMLVFFPAMIMLKGLDHKNNAPQTKVIKQTPTITRSEAFRSLAFWKMIVIFSLSFFPLGTMLVQQVPFLTDMGIKPESAAWILSLTAMMGMVGKLSWGFVFDKVQGRYAVSTAIVVQMLAVAWLLQADKLWEALVFGMAYGFGMGGMVPLHTAFRSRQFGAKHIGAIMGISSPFIMLAQAGGQPFSGRVFDITGTYRIAFLLFIGCYLLAIAVAMTLKDPEPHPEK